MKKKKVLSMYDELMLDPEFKKEFDKGYKELLLSELEICLKEKDFIAAKKLQKEIDKL